jgi:hypothetical protein
MNSITLAGVSRHGFAESNGSAGERIAAETRADRVDLLKDMALATLMAAAMFGVAAVVLLASFKV